MEQYEVASTLRRRHLKRQLFSNQPRKRRFFEDALQTGKLENTGFVFSCERKSGTSRKR